MKLKEKKVVQCTFLSFKLQLYVQILTSSRNQAETNRDFPHTSLIHQRILLLFQTLLSLAAMQSPMIKRPFKINSTSMFFKSSATSSRNLFPYLTTPVTTTEAYFYQLWRGDANLLEIALGNIITLSFEKEKTYNKFVYNI